MTSPEKRAALLESYLGRDPTNATLRGELVDLLIQMGQLEVARQHATQALDQQPEDSLSRYRLAVIDHRSGRHDAAREALTTLIKSGVDAPGVRYELGRVQAAQGDFSACADTLAPLSLTVLPEQLAADITLLRVRSLHHVGELQSAIEIAEQFLQLVPNAPALTSALATLYLDAGRLDDADLLYRAAGRNQLLDGEMLAVGGFVELNAANIAVARENFEQSAAKAPGSGRAFLGLGLVHAAAGRSADSKEALAKAISCMPSHLGSRHALAWMQLLDKEFDAAEQTFDEALAIDRNFGDTYGGLAILAALRGDRTTAEEHIRTGRRLDKASLNVGFAVTLLRHGSTMNSPDFLDSALKMLHEHALSKDATAGAVFQKLLSYRAGNTA